MRSLLVGDLHIGIKSNSITWLENQIKFFKDQIIESIRTKNVDQAIFLGDIHDIRFSINQQIGYELKNIITEMVSEFPDKKFIFVAGNHDYFTPLEEYDKYNIYTVLFGEEYTRVHKNVQFIWEAPYLDDFGYLYLPWYWTENPLHFDEILYQYNFSKDIKAIFCHTDLSIWPGARIASLQGVPVYSGHIHNIYEDKLCNLHNIGAALPLTFNDVNDARYIYVLEDFDIVEKIENVTTPRFNRIYNEEIFEDRPELYQNSYMQLCISSNNINTAKYIDQIKFLKSQYVNANIRIHIIDDTVNLKTLEVDGFDMNINKYIEDNIPEYLDTKYNKIKTKLAEQ